MSLEDKMICTLNNLSLCTLYQNMVTMKDEIYRQVEAGNKREADIKTAQMITEFDKLQAEVEAAGMACCNKE